MNESNLIFYAIIGILGIALMLYGIFVKQETVNADDLSAYGKFLVKTIQKSDKNGVMVERNYYFTTGCPPISHSGHCFSRAIGAEFNPYSGWWIIFEYQGGLAGLSTQHIYKNVSESDIKICSDQTIKPTDFRMYEKE